MAKPKKKSGRNLIEKVYRGKHYYGKTEREVLDKIAAAKYKEQYGYTFQEIADAYEQYITSANSPIRRGTVNSYRKHLRQIVPYFNDTYMSDIDPQAVRGYLEKLKLEGKSKSTITNAKSVISRVFAFWCARYHGTANPVDLVELPPALKEQERREPTEAEMALINAHTEGAGFWAQLFRYTGIRLGEANALRWADVDFEKGIIRIDDAMPWEGNTPYAERVKSKKAVRSVPILAPFRPLLLQEKANHADTDFVLSGTEKPLTKSQYDKRWEAYCRPLGLSTYKEYTVQIAATACRPARTTTRKVWRSVVTAHQFRHLYATVLFEAGIPDLGAQQLLGHADITTTRRVYQHVREKQRDHYADLLNQYLASEHK